MSKCKPVERVQCDLFKRYAVEFVHAAIQPMRDNRKVMEGICECVPIYEHEEIIHPTHVIVATMSIAKDYYDDLQLIRRTSRADLSKMQIKDGLMENIRKILVVLQRSMKDYDSIHLNEIIGRYLLQKKQDPAVEASGYDESSKSAVRCYRSMRSLSFVGFYDELAEGFDIVSALLLADDKGLNDDPIVKEQRATLDTITAEISQYRFSIPYYDDIELEDEAEEFRKSLTGNGETISDSSTDSDTDTE